MKAREVVFVLQNHKRQDKNLMTHFSVFKPKIFLLYLEPDEQSNQKARFSALVLFGCMRKANGGEGRHSACQISDLHGLFPLDGF